MPMNLRKGKAFTTREDRRVPETKKVSPAAVKVMNKRIENAEKLNEFGGKRFLGLTPKGAEVYVYYIIDRETMTIQMDFSHRPSLLLKDGAKLANNRYSTRRGKSITTSIDHMTRVPQKKNNQEVTEQTLNHLMRLKNLNDIKFHKGYDKGKVSTLMTRYVTDVIYTGNYESSSEYPTIQDLLQVWEFPMGGSYFVPEEAWSYPDDLDTL